MRPAAHDDDTPVSSATAIPATVKVLAGPA
jgi:hypothetical protein